MSALKPGIRAATILITVMLGWFLMRSLTESTHLAVADDAAKLLGTAGLGLLVANWWQRRKYAVELCSELHSDTFFEVRNDAWNRVEEWGSKKNTTQVAVYFQALEPYIVDADQPAERKVINDALPTPVETREHLLALADLRDLQARRFRQSHGFSRMLSFMSRTAVLHDSGMLDGHLARRLLRAFFDHYRSYFVEWALTHRKYQELLKAQGEPVTAAESSDADNVIGFFTMLKFDTAPARFECFLDPSGDGTAQINSVIEAAVELRRQRLAARRDAGEVEGVI
ncbi:MAG: hypothetical protein OER88_08925 [Planctomycetota bacterium]|nr:hypothetical protein [Planctomycetota bacterium]